MPIAPDRKPTSAARAEAPECGNRGNAPVETVIARSKRPASLPAAIVDYCLNGCKNLASLAGKFAGAHVQGIHVYLSIKTLQVLSAPYAARFHRRCLTACAGLRALPRHLFDRHAFIADPLLWRLPIRRGPFPLLADAALRKKSVVAILIRVTPIRVRPEAGRVCYFHRDCDGLTSTVRTTRLTARRKWTAMLQARTASVANV